jgi:hypothetical protein
MHNNVTNSNLLLKFIYKTFILLSYQLLTSRYWGLYKVGGLALLEKVNLLLFRVLVIFK